MSKFAPHHRSTNQPRPNLATVCQKCLKTGHFIFECKSERPYVSRPSRTQQLDNPKLLAKLRAEGKPSVEVPEEFKNRSGTANQILVAKEKERMKAIEAAADDESSSKKRRRSETPSSSSSDSDSGSDSDSSGSGSDSSDSSSSESEAEPRAGAGSSPSRSRARPRKRRRRSSEISSDGGRSRSSSVDSRRKR